MDLTPLMTAKEVAALFRVEVEQVKRWARTGQLRGTRTPGGHWRFKCGDVQRLIDQGADGVSDVDDRASRE